MAETIETFVEKLQKQGVEAGQAEAEEIRAKAREDADRIIEDAKKQAEEITSDAEKEARSTLERSQSELNLAARDTVARLRKTIETILESLLSRAAGEQLTDLAFLGQIMHEIISLYAKADVEGKPMIKLNVPHETQEKLAEWALGEISHGIDGEHPLINFKGTLGQAGFEYEIDGGTVEVTVDSVVELLSGIISPTLRKVIQEAAGDSKDSKE